MPRVLFCPLKSGNEKLMAVRQGDFQAVIPNPFFLHLLDGGLDLGVHGITAAGVGDQHMIAKPTSPIGVVQQ